jgi:hypothetical protein
VHQAGHELSVVGVAVELDPLDQADAQFPAPMTATRMGFLLLIFPLTPASGPASIRAKVLRTT